MAPTTDVVVARPTARTVALPRTPKPCPSCGEGIVYPGNKCRFCGFHYVDTPAARTYAHTPGRYQTGSTRAPAQYLPAITTTVRITLLFGLSGMIPATMHTNQAMMVGQPTNKYWKAFGVAIGVEIGFWLLLYLILIAGLSSAVNSYRY